MIRLCIFDYLKLSPTLDLVQANQVSKYHAKVAVLIAIYLNFMNWIYVKSVLSYEFNVNILKYSNIRNQEAFKLFVRSW